ncbi:MAG: PilZ domain-containing protein [Granulosicoccus sp.]
MLSEEEKEGRNRREAFRINDTVKLKIRALDQQSLDAITDNFNAHRLRYCIKSHLLNQNEVRKPKLIRIRKKDPDIAEYLESLELQITQLAERLDQDSDSLGDTIEFNGRANLSSTGIRFHTRLPFVAGQIIEIGMVLSTQGTQVVTIGEVLRAESDSDDNLISLSISYTHIHPEDSEAIIRHLAKLQQRELQARRGSGEF